MRLDANYRFGTMLNIMSNAHGVDDMQRQKNGDFYTFCDSDMCESHYNINYGLTLSDVSDTTFPS
jgi:hypothetical protein